MEGVAGSLAGKFFWSINLRDKRFEKLAGEFEIPLLI